MEMLTDDQRYAAITARDARFDGVFFTCVRSTGIFCRPSCPSRTPHRDRVEFTASAAAAVERGYRACKRCGPLSPPGADSDDPADALAVRALALIHAGALDVGPDGSPTVSDLASQLHVTERTLHRALVARTGSGAVAHARMARARRAHELLRSTPWPMGDIAVAAGFGSERQLHETVSRIFGRAPSRIRELGSPQRALSGARRARGIGPLTGLEHEARLHGKERMGSEECTDGRDHGDEIVHADATSVVHADLAVRRPFHGAGLASWFAARAITGVEHVEDLVWTRAVPLPHGPAVLQVDLGAVDGPLPLTARLTDLRDYAAAVATARRMLDLDADPQGIDTGLRAAMPALVPLLEARPGVRMPGTPSLAEALMWAIVGQQITTARARDLLESATDLAGADLPARLRTAHVHRLSVSPGEAGARAEEWFRGPGARRRTLTSALTDPPDPHLPLPELRSRLLAIPGIGPWTAEYALLRGARAIDVAPPRDVALLAVARALGLAEDFPALDQVLAAASPWRSYAVMHLWHHRDDLPPELRTLRKDRS